jgi:hypothetical protein
MTMQNATQLRLDQVDREFPPLQDPGDEAETIEARFRAFHEANPHVYGLLRALALDYLRAGHDRCGIKMLYEVLRYQSGIYTKTNEPYQLNNDFTALYARLLMEQEPVLDGFFETRKRRAQ